MTISGNHPVSGCPTLIPLVGSGQHWWEVSWQGREQVKAALRGWAVALKMKETLEAHIFMYTASHHHQKGKADLPPFLPPPPPLPHSGAEGAWYNSFPPQRRSSGSLSPIFSPARTWWNLDQGSAQDEAPGRPSKSRRRDQGATTLKKICVLPGLPGTNESRGDTFWKALGGHCQGELLKGFSMSWHQICILGARYLPPNQVFYFNPFFF